MSEYSSDLVDLNVTSSEEEKVNQILTLDINQFPELKRVHFLGRDAARYSLNSIQEAFRRGLLNLNNFRNVVDFGAGTGGPAFVLERVCQIAGGKLVALEQDQAGIEHIKSLCPAVPIYEGDGLSYLEEKKSEIDLIVAFKLGPDYHAELFRLLATVSGKALTENGRLLIYSDIKTISAVRSRVSSLNVNIIPELSKNDTYKYVPETIILSKEDCVSLPVL